MLHIDGGHYLHKNVDFSLKEALKNSEEMRVCQFCKEYGNCTEFQAPSLSAFEC
jgi:hypothetical protein